MGWNGMPYGARLQELGNGDEDGFSASGLRSLGGALPDSVVRKGQAARAISNDALYYDGVDTRWNARGGIDHENAVYGPAYEDDYYGARLDPEEDELLVQRALNRVRIARSYGQSSVSLTHEELEALARPHFQQSPNLSGLAAARPSSKGHSSSGGSQHNNYINKDKNKNNSTSTRTSTGNSSSSNSNSNSNSNNSNTRSRKPSSRPFFLPSSPRSSRARSGKSGSKQGVSSAHVLDVSSSAPPPTLRIPGASAPPVGYAYRSTSRSNFHGANGAYHTALDREGADPSYDADVRGYTRPSSRDSIGILPAEGSEYTIRRADPSRLDSSVPDYSFPPPSFELGRCSDTDPFAYQTGGPPPSLFAHSNPSLSTGTKPHAFFNAPVAAPQGRESRARTTTVRRVRAPPGVASAAESPGPIDFAELGRGSISEPALNYQAWGGQRNNGFEVEVEYEAPSSSGSSRGESHGAQERANVCGATAARAGSSGRVKDFDRMANASGRSGSGNGSGSGSGRKRKGKRK